MDSFKIETIYSIIHKQFVKKHRHCVQICLLPYYIVAHAKNRTPKKIRTVWIHSAVEKYLDYLLLLILDAARFI